MAHPFFHGSLDYAHALEDNRDLASDQSSIISLSERMADTDVEEDTRKYRLPDIGKTRLHLHTKKEFEDVSSATPLSISTSASGTPDAGATPGATSPRPPVSDGDASDSDFVASGISRAASIYTLSRVSLASQLSQLTSIQLPNAISLSSRITSISTCVAASKALSDAAEQIRLWMKKASDVLNGLDAEDDVEWAAAGGRDGLEEVDSAISRFDTMVRMYIIAIEELQMRTDISDLSAEQLRANVEQMEGILKEWQKVKETLRGVKEQVEVAMEWEELCNTVLGEIGQELDELGRLVFEMEEKRHRSVIAEAFAEAANGVDINHLATIVEEKPSNRKSAVSNRFSLPPFSPTSPVRSPPASNDKDDQNLLALFARMQPLRASLDFLPMRLSVFHCRGNPVFPTACIELEKRRDALEEQWKKLEGDAEALRRELGEDRWVLVFRNAGRQALKMCESVTRSHDKLKEAIGKGEQHANMPVVARMIESYEAKKTHYGPAIERVLAIIDRGVLDRLTVNGEILRLQSDMKRRWNALEADMRDLDISLEEITANSRNQQLRDSISTILSSERSLASSAIDTPGSSPASSVVLTSRKSSFHDASTPIGSAKKAITHYKLRLAEQHSAQDAAFGKVNSFTGEFNTERLDSTIPNEAHRTLHQHTLPLLRELKQPAGKPRFSTSTSGSASVDFLPLSALEPSRYRKTPVPRRTITPRTPASQLATPSPLSRNATSPTPPKPTSPSTPSFGRQLSASASSPLAPPSTTPLAAGRSPSSLASYTRSRITTPASGKQAAAGTRRKSLLGPPLADENDADTETKYRSRPPSALATPSGRRSSSVLPQPKAREKGGGRDSRLEGSVLSVKEKPRWR
ncbi:hypothetical protein H2203_007043 [Taxawa tesnikishii (nom. ined.)]|nr:hypothetical protein H2203_007043 [Dothideales sp. JES 119]